MKWQVLGLKYFPQPSAQFIFVSQVEVELGVKTMKRIMKHRPNTTPMTN